MGSKHSWQSRVSLKLYFVWCKKHHYSVCLFPGSAHTFTTRPSVRYLLALRINPGFFTDPVVRPSLSTSQVLFYFFSFSTVCSQVCGLLPAKQATPSDFLTSLSSISKKEEETAHWALQGTWGSTLVIHRRTTLHTCWEFKRRLRQL